MTYRACVRGGRRRRYRRRVARKILRPIALVVTRMATGLLRHETRLEIVL
jgi:hypothetical protein